MFLWCIWAKHIWWIGTEDANIINVDADEIEFVWYIIKQVILKYSSGMDK